MEVGFLTLGHYLAIRQLGDQFGMVCHTASLQWFKK